MSKTGAMFVSDAVTTVQSVGSLGDVDGWSIVAIVPTSVFLSGTAPYTIFASGMLGETFYAGTASRARVEVGLFAGTSATAAPLRVHRSYINDGGISYQASLVRMRGMPWGFLWNTYPGNWTSTDPIVIKARVFLNGDTLVGPQFLVSNVGVLVLDLTRIGAGNYLAHRFTAGAGEALANTQLEGSKQYWRSNQFGHADESWLVFSNLVYSPRTGTAPMWWQVDYAPTNTWNNPTYIAGRTRFGTLLRGGVASGGHLISQTHFGVIPTTGVFTTVGLRGLDRHNETSARTVLETWEFFACKISGQGYFTSHSDYANFQTLALTNGVESSYWPVEVSQAYAGDMVLLFQATNDWDIGGVHSFRAHAKMENGYATIPKDRRMSIAVVDRTEGWSHQAIGFRGASPAAVQHRFLVSRNAQEGATEALRVNDLSACAFDWETSPNTTPFPGVIAGPEVSVATDFESLSTASLTDLPFKPDAVSPLSYALERNELRTKRGDLITWPKFTTGRQVHGVRLTLSRTDTETLLTFLRDQDRAAFKLTPPWQSTALPVVVVSDPQVTDGGIVQTVEFQVVELTWRGP